MGKFLGMQTRFFIVASVCGALLSACTEGSNDTYTTVKRGQAIYAKECSRCHGPHGEGTKRVSSGPGAVPPDLTALKQQNNGFFPRMVVRQFVMGAPEDDSRTSAMPKFAYVGLRHVYPNGGADGEVLEADFEDLLDYLEAIQK